MTNENSEETETHSSVETSAEQVSDSHDQVEVADSKPTNPNFKWYVVQAFSTFEQKAKSALEERIKMHGFEEKFGEIIIPTQQKEITLKSGKKKQSTKTQFPGYMLVQMDLNDATLSLVKNTPRIGGFVGNPRAPRPMSEAEVLRHTQGMDVAPEDQAAPVIDIAFEKGEGVKVIDGPFNNFDGVVDEVKPDKARLRVLVSIFGRETPVDLEYRQVEKLS